MRNFRFAAVLIALLTVALVPGASRAEKRAFDMTIEDTKITLVEQQGFHTFAFNGQVPGPLFHLKEGDDVSVNVHNLTALPHTIHWHGLIMKNNWKNDGVPGVSQNAIEPGKSFTYKFVAEPSGTMWYHCHVNVNEHVVMRGMWGPFIIDPKKPTELEKKVTKDYILMLSDWDSKYAFKPGYGGVPGDVYDYFTINGRSFPDTQPIRVKKGDVVRIRLVGAGEFIHAIHPHGHTFKVAFKDGRPLPAPYEADTLIVGPGERYDIIMEANNPGLFPVHDHVDSHTLNGAKPMGGLMTVIEYEGVSASADPVYAWKDKIFTPDFYYEESLKKGHGMFGNSSMKGQAIQ
ncbi:MAG: multicopper oxidase domain-containing protein [Nitrospinae bacterium]|nr:multicopper oxidase domain-containing protein [Nitrospinota bacterium]